MKKMIMMVALMLATLNLGAQQLEGTYQADEQFQQLMNSRLEKIELGIDASIKVGFSLFFFNEQIVPTVNADVYAEGLKLKADILLPGTYQRNGDQCECTFDKENLQVAIQDMKSDDPEVQQMLDDNDSSDNIYGMVESMADEMVREKADQITKILEFCKSFTIKEQTDTSVTLLFNEKLEVLFSKLQ
ncbi:MAG: hypothetical protein IJ163_10430 [Bacteroidaceae bacterium]|nr:hypothetical protein [Bacteroidaceae bacterium]